jgi:hypothetical protein
LACVVEGPDVVEETWQSIVNIFEHQFCFFQLNQLILEEEFLMLKKAAQCDHCTWYWRYILLLVSVFYPKCQCFS